MPLKVNCICFKSTGDIVQIIWLKIDSYFLATHHAKLKEDYVIST